MKFHPVISIILGIVTIFIGVIVAFGILSVFTAYSSLEGTIFIVSMVVYYSLILIGAGFISNYFTKKKKILYSVCEAIIVTALMIIGLYISILLSMVSGVLIVIGGYFAIIIDKHLKQNTAEPESIETPTEIDSNLYKPSNNFFSLEIADCKQYCKSKMGVKGSAALFYLLFIRY